MHEVPRHDPRVALREVVLRPAGALVQVGRAGAHLADPPRIGLRGNRVPDVTQGVEDVHGHVLDAVLVAGDDHPADLPVEDRLLLVVQPSGQRVEPLHHSRRHAGLVAQPDRRSQHEDVRCQHPLGQRGPVVRGQTLLAHVRLHTRRDVVVHRSHQVDRDALAPHVLHRDVHQALRVRGLVAGLQGAVDEQGAEVREPSGAGGLRSGCHASSLTPRAQRRRWALRPGRSRPARRRVPAAARADQALRDAGWAR